MCMWVSSSIVGLSSLRVLGIVGALGDAFQEKQTSLSFSLVLAPAWVGARSPDGLVGQRVRIPPWRFGVDSQAVGPTLSRTRRTTTKPTELHWKPMSWLGSLRPTTVDDAWAPAIWQTFFTSTLGLEVPVLSFLPRHHNLPAAKCGCKKFLLDVHGDHISTCTAHSGATKAHDWMVGRLGRWRACARATRTTRLLPLLPPREAAMRSRALVGAASLVFPIGSVGSSTS